jgi:hypothetical protein
MIWDWRIIIPPSLLTLSSPGIFHFLPSFTHMLVYISHPRTYPPSIPLSSPPSFLDSSLGAIQIIGEAFCHIILGASFFFLWLHSTCGLVCWTDLSTILILVFGTMHSLASILSIYSYFTTAWSYLGLSIEIEVKVNQ